HEGGHRIDKMFGLRNMPELASELMRLGDSRVKGSMSSWKEGMPADYRRGEGVAEFIRFYLLEPETAQSVAPKTWARFNKILDSNPEFGAAFRQMQADAQAYRNSSAVAKLAASIKRTEPVPIWKGMDKADVKHRYNQLIAGIFNRAHFIKKMDEDAALAKGSDLLPSERGEIRYDQMAGSPSVADKFVR